MTLDDLRALADKFFVWPEGSGRQTVTTFSALLFAQHVLQLRKKSLGTENSAGMDALRNAAQRQLDALGGYRREIGLLTGVPDEQPCDAEVAARAALEQQAEPKRYFVTGDEFLVTGNEFYGAAPEPYATWGEAMATMLDAGVIEGLRISALEKAHGIGEEE